MSDRKASASNGENEQVDSPPLQEPEPTGRQSVQAQSPDERPQRAAGNGLGIAALLVALCALALALWQWSQRTVDVGDSSDSPVIENLTSRLGEVERSLSDQSQSLSRINDQTSDDHLNSRLASLVDTRVESLLGAQDDASFEARIDAHLDNRIDDDLEPVNRRLDELAAAVNETGERASNIESAVSGLEDAVTSGDRQREELVQRIEQAAGVQREADQELALRLALLQAAALLRFGQTQAELTGDYASAAAAFRRAQSLLQSNADPRIGQARQRLSAELDALESSRGPDWAEAQSALVRLSDQVAHWPLHSSNDEPSSPLVQNDSADGWWAGMKRSLGQLVEVERRDPLELDADQVSALREQLRLRLVAAELAIERRDMESARRHLRQVDERIERHFDLSSADVTEARVTLDEIQSLRLPDPPSALGSALASLNLVLEAL